MSDKENQKKLSVESYKGVRDFYPADLFVQNYIFDTWKAAVESFGYEEYAASILESSEIYKAKSGQELVGEQTYTFVDRGEREVTLRPEMTPSLARMVAARKRELGFPLRLYSIPNCFRYERPQRGRMREFWQLNVDLLTKKPNARYDVEILKLVSNIMTGFGAKDGDFEIRVNSRPFVYYLYKEFMNATDEISFKIQKLNDKKDKLSQSEFIDEYKKLTNSPIPDFDNEEFMQEILNIPNIKKPFEEMLSVIDACKAAGVRNIRFDATVTRGLDYYTGIVFEVFDTNEENNRALFGGGRYDGLVDMFEGAADETPISGIGFGMGDVPMMNFLESRNLLPKYEARTNILVAVLEETEDILAYADEVASELRANENVAVSYTARKYPDLVKLAEKLGIERIAVIGANEAKERSYEVKEV